MTAFADTFVGKELHEIEAFFDSKLALALKILKGSVDALVADIEKNGANQVEAAFTAAVAAAGAETAAGKSPEEAGKAAVVAAGTALAADATQDLKDAVTAGKAVLSADTTHAIATSVVAAA